MVSEGLGRLFKRKDGKFLLYLPKDLCEDSMFPFKGEDSIKVKVSFLPEWQNMISDRKKVLLVEEAPAHVEGIHA
jgi:hypothetical protein